MNMINDFLNNRKELTIIQRNNDEKMRHLECKDIVAIFLLFERHRTREQIDNLSKHKIWTVGNYFIQMNEINKINLNFLSDLLESDSLTICKKLEEISRIQPINYSN